MLGKMLSRIVSNPWREAIEEETLRARKRAEAFPILGGRLLKSVRSNSETCSK